MILVLSINYQLLFSTSSAFKMSTSDVYSELEFLYILNKIFGIVSFGIEGRPKRRIFVYKSKNIIYISVHFMVFLSLFSYSIRDRINEIHILKLEHIPEFVIIVVYFLQIFMLFVYQIFYRCKIEMFYINLQRTVNLSEMFETINYSKMKKIVMFIFTVHILTYIVFTIIDYYVFSFSLMLMIYFYFECVSVLVMIEFFIVLYLISSSLKNINDNICSERLKELFVIHSDFFEYCKKFERFSLIVAFKFVVTSSSLVYTLFVIAIGRFYGDSEFLYRCNNVTWCIYNTFYVLIVVIVCERTNREVR